MNNKLIKLKIGAYFVLVILAAWTGISFYGHYKKVNTTVNLSETNDITQIANDAAPTTNQSNQATNTVPPTNAPVSTTNVSTSVTNASSTNAVAQSTNVAPAAPTNVASDKTVLQTAAAKSGNRGSMIGYLGAFIACAILLGLLIAYDVSQFFGNRTVDFLFNDEGKGMKTPEYEQAEAVWANGKPLDAIQMMRDYLKKYPNEQYVALRIAEIYEKDLKNDLAAALEYEQVLQKKVEPERWGWAAIHLCNLYSRMGKTKDAVALLRRIDSEYGETAAAKKARTRLAMFETGDAEALGTDAPEGTTPTLPPLPKKEDKTPASNLPPGFRPKK